MTVRCCRSNVTVIVTVTANVIVAVTALASNTIVNVTDTDDVTLLSLLLFNVAVTCYCEF